MSRYRAVARAALVAHLKDGPALGAAVYSNPPRNHTGQLILVGDIIAEPPEDKGGQGGFYNANIEIWSHTFSPAEVDAIADAVIGRLEDAVMTSPGRTFHAALFAGEQVQGAQDEADEPVFGRILAFRFYLD